MIDFDRFDARHQVVILTSNTFRQTQFYQQKQYFQLFPFITHLTVIGRELISSDETVHHVNDTNNNSNNNINNNGNIYK